MSSAVAHSVSHVEDVDNIEEQIQLINTYTPIFSSAIPESLFSDACDVEIEELQIFAYFYNIDNHANDEQIQVHINSILSRFVPDEEERNNMTFSGQHCGMGASIDNDFHHPIYVEYSRSIFELMINTFENFRDTIDNNCRANSRFYHVADFILKSYQNFSMYYYNTYVLPTMSNEKMNVNKEYIIDDYCYLVNEVLNFVDKNIGNYTAFRHLDYNEITDREYICHMLPHGEDIEQITFENTKFTDLVSKDVYVQCYDHMKDVANYERNEDDDEDEEEEDEEEDD
jgi:hypothetical protein